MSTTLDQMFLSKKVPQSLLFSWGSREEAIGFVKKLFGDRHKGKIDSGNHPDLHFYLPDEKSGFHPMASMQRLIAEMSMPPFETACKVFVIEEADKMLPSGSNALLKTLEEPPEDTYLILLSNAPGRLLPTILSRLSVVNFGEDEVLSTDLSTYIEMAQSGQWDEVIDRLKNLEEEDPQSIFKAILESIKDPKLFEKISSEVSKGQKALEHNVKLRTILLNLLLQISS